MLLSPIVWSLLSKELLHEILDALVNAYDEDPAYQWTTLRHICSRQMHSIERHFLNFWVPKLCITLYDGPWSQLDYSYAKCVDEDCRTVRFKRLPDTDPGSPRNVDVDRLKHLWSQYSFENRVAHLRLGEGEKLLNMGIRGGAMINDSDIADLVVEGDGIAITFDWKKTMDALLREEKLLLVVTKDLTLKKIRDLEDRDEWPASEENQRIELVKHLVLDIQMRRRVMVQRHRLYRHDPFELTGSILGSISHKSKYLHKQDLSKIPPSATQQVCCGICSRRDAPDIFEVLSQEESVVPSLSGWKNLQEKELLNLYAEEFGWRCCRCQCKEDEILWQQKRKSDWKKGGRGNLYRNDRWDPLG